MWTCPTCRETHDDDQFECWQCGTHHDGEVNPDFQRALAEREAEPETFNLLDTFTCPTCGGTEARLESLAPARTILLQRVRRSLLVCKSCGFEEVYLHDKSAWGVLRLFPW